MIAFCSGSVDAVLYH